MSDTLLANQYIGLHNLSLTDGVSCYKLRGARQGDYVIVYDRRTHPLSVFANSFNAETIHDKISEAARKILHNLRDKWNEADRPFVPRRFRTPETWQIYTQAQQCNNPETRPGLLQITNNRPIFNVFPIWCFKNSPIFTLLLRVPRIFNWLKTRSDVVHMLLAGPSTELFTSIKERDWLRYIEDTEGQAPLESVGFRETTEITIDALISKAESAISFQTFTMIRPELTTVVSEETFFNRLDQYQIHPEYALVSRLSPSTGQTRCVFDGLDDLNHAGYTLTSWIDEKGTLYERYIYRDEPGKDYHCILVHHGDATEQRPDLFYDEDAESINPDCDPNNAKLMLWKLEPLYISKVLLTETITRSVKGTYITPANAQTNAAIIPFREPMSCASADIDGLKDTDFPLIAQPKLDGNRVIVYVFDADNIRPFVKYYSRNGISQTAKFNQHFDKDVIQFCYALRARKGHTNADNRGPQPREQVLPMRNLMLDCECYAHDVIHSEIGGWCNRIAISPEFRQLKLFILSWLDLDKLSPEKIRGRDYTVGNISFNDILIQDQELLQDIMVELAENNRDALILSQEDAARALLANNGNDISPVPRQSPPELEDCLALRVNRSLRVDTREELYEIMAEIIELGGEGLVLYPMTRPYTFANAGLKKIKKFYDGEGIVLEYKASSTDPTEIGSVLVKVKMWFGKKPNAHDDAGDVGDVNLYVNAALRQEVKRGSMISANFANCIGRAYTIVCGSFSDEGVPIHARFKAPFGLENERLDI